MEVERIDRQTTQNGPLSRPALDSEVVLSRYDAEESRIPQHKEPSADTEQVEKPYSIYTSSEKWFIVSVASLGALFR